MGHMEGWALLGETNSPFYADGMATSPGNGLLLDTLERLLEIPSADLKTALTLACDAVAAALRADKVDAFLLDPTKNTLVAIGTSNQPLSNLQRNVGLDVLPIANGGRVVQVFETKAPFRTGRLTEDAGELKGVREVLKIDSKLGVPIDVGNQIRGVLMIASQKRDFFTDEDERFALSISRWVGSVAHRAELVEEIERNALKQGRRAAAEELVTILAHDLRNFVAPISARLQLIQRRASQDQREADVHDSDAALRAVRRLSRLIADILDVARIDQGVFRLDLAPIDLGALAADIAKTLSTPSHAIHVASMDEVVVSADSARIAQCLENILSNAIRHSPRDAPVTVLVSKRPVEQGQVGAVEVLDEGPGVPPEILPRIFERFSAGSDSSGLGLGLYLAKRIAQAHGGELNVESPPGKGARFRLELPMAADD
jgi:two-component system, OmpR family, sensor kinase